MVERNLSLGEAAGPQSQMVPTGTWCPQNIYGDPSRAQGSLGQVVLCEDSVGEEVKPSRQELVRGNGGKVDERVTTLRKVVCG